MLMLHTEYLGNKTEYYDKDKRRFAFPKEFLRVPLFDNQFRAFPAKAVHQGEQYNIIALYNPFIIENFPSLWSGDLIEVSSDKRTCLPEHLDDYLKPTDRITLVGVGQRLELWLPENYDRCEQKRDRDKFWRAIEKARVKDAKKEAWQKMCQNYQEAVKQGLFKPDQPLDDYDYKNLEFLDLNQLEKTCAHKA